MCCVLTQKAKVPCVPGSEGLIKDEDDCLRVVNEIGLPVMIKATAGGGSSAVKSCTRAACQMGGMQQQQMMMMVMVMVMMVCDGSWCWWMKKVERCAG
jgi:acetyl/propionyl-CoA carboxylase alpha subunit